MDRLRAFAVRRVAVIVALTAFSVCALVSCHSSGDAGAGPATTVASAGTTTAGSNPTADDADSSATDKGAGSGTTASTPASVRSTTTEDTRPPSAAAQTLEVETFPAGADITIDLQDGTEVTGTSPFSEQVAGGRITIGTSLPGYNPVTREVVLEEAQTVKIWLDPEGQLYQSVVRFSCGKQPKQVLFTPDGTELWVAILGGGNTGLEAYDPLTGEKLAAIRLGGHEGTELTMTRDGSTIFVSQMATNTIWVVDRASRKVVRHFKCGGSYPKILLLSRDEKLLYSSNWKSNDVSEIDWATGRVKRIIPVVQTPRGLYITPDGKYLYVSGFGVGELQKIDLATGRAKVLYKTGGSFRHMAVDETTNFLYVGEFADGEVYVCDLATDKVRKLCDTDQRPNTIELGSDGKVLYVSNRGKDNPETGYLTKGPEWGSALAIDTATGEILDAIVGGNQCTGLDVSPDGTLLAFSDFLDHAIRVYRIPDNAALAEGGGGRAATHLQDIIKD